MKVLPPALAACAVALACAAPASAFPGLQTIRLSEAGLGDAHDPTISHDKRYARVVAYEQGGKIYVVRRAAGYGENGSPWRVGSRRLIATGTRPSIDGTSR